MARRDRVPRRKGHTYKRNKNPKLSPFQREQKRARLANQAPTAKSQGTDHDIPHSQRRLYEYLQASQKRAEARRRARTGEDIATAQTNGETTYEATSQTTLHSHPDGTNQRASATPCLDPNNARVPSNTNRATMPSATALSTSRPSPPVASLNEEMLRDLAPVTAPRTLNASTGVACQSVEDVIARKKARKHAKKQEVRRQRVAARLANVDKELAELTHRRGNTARQGRNGDEVSGERDETPNRAFERELRRMQKSKTTAATKAPPAQRTRSRRRHHPSAGSDDVMSSEGGKVQAEDTNATHQPTRASEFYELVDVVRYGERVEAPPTFDKLPNPHAAVSRLAEQLTRPSLPRRAASSNDRHSLLSSRGGLGEQRRLTRLGLAGQPASVAIAAGGTGGSGSTSTNRGGAPQSAVVRKEMELLREQVMAAYQRNKRNAIAEKKGVDLRHVFPRFA